MGRLRIQSSESAAAGSPDRKEWMATNRAHADSDLDKMQTGPQYHCLCGTVDRALYDVLMLICYIN